MALLGRGKGNSGQTVKAAKTGNGSGRTTASKKAAAKQQEEIGVKYTQQKHECTTGKNGCDSPCPLAHPAA
jgi:hypothetical protein